MLVQHDSGSQSALTRSAVQAGSITITDEANQRQDVAMLNRDAGALSGTVARTPDLQSKLNRQAEVMTAVQEVGEVVAKQIGRYANGKREAALEEMKQAQARGDAKLAAHYEAQAERWSEGGKGRALMQAAGVAVTVGLGGGNAVGAAAGAGVSSLAGGKLDELAERIRASKLTDNADVDEALANIVTNSLATVLGAAVGGNAGAVGAYNVDRFNRQLRPDERQWAKDNAKSFTKFYEEKTGKAITVEQALDMLLANGYRLVDAAASKGPGGDATAVAFISQNDGSQFKATPAEYSNLFLYGNKDGSLTPEQRVLPGHEAHPQIGMAAGAAAGLFTLGAVAPTVETAWALGATYDYAGNVISRAMGLSSEGPNVGKSLAVGGVAAATAPFFLPLNALGNATGGKVAVGAYNALWSGVGAFGATAMTNPGSSPDLSAGIGTASSLFGAGIEAKMPGPIGMSINQLLQVLSGPTQAAIEADKQRIPEK